MARKRLRNAATSPSPAGSTSSARHVEPLLPPSAGVFWITMRTISPNASVAIAR